MSMNLNNFEIATGRIVRDPVVKDHSKARSYLFTVAVDRGYKNDKGEVEADMLDFVGYVQNKHLTDDKGNAKNNPFDYLKKGNEVTVLSHRQTYTQEVNGETAYREKHVVDKLKLGRSSKANAIADGLIQD